MEKRIAYEGIKETYLGLETLVGCRDSSWISLANLDRERHSEARDSQQPNRPRLVERVRLAYSPPCLIRSIKAAIHGGKGCRERILDSPATTGTETSSHHASLQREDKVIRFFFSSSALCDDRWWATSAACGWSFIFLFYSLSMRHHSGVKKRQRKENKLYFNTISKGSMI
jgi:hypothetical protein